MYRLPKVFCVILIILLTEFACEHDHNGKPNQESNTSNITGLDSVEVFSSSEKAYISSKIRHFDWQKKSGNPPPIDEEIASMVEILEITSTPIIKEFSRAKKIAAPLKENYPEMEISEIKSAEQVGDVHLILWGANASESSKQSTQTPAIEKYQQKKEDQIKDEKRIDLNAETSTSPDVTSTKNSTTPSVVTSSRSSTSSTTQPTASSPRIASFATPQSLVSQAKSSTEAILINNSSYTPTTPNSTTARSLSTTTKATVEDFLDSMPSFEEDMIRTYTLNNKEHYGHGHAKAKYITKELEKMNFTHYDEEKDGGKVIDFLHVANPEIENTTQIVKMHRKK